MYKWKERRGRRRKDWENNTEDDVRNLSAQAFSAPDEARRVLHLCRLNGVGVAFASAFLTLTDPEHDGVIDKRVWEILYLYQEIDYNSGGKN